MLKRFIAISGILFLLSCVLVYADNSVAETSLVETKLPEVVSLNENEKEALLEKADDKKLKAKDDGRYRQYIKHGLKKKR